MHLRFLNVVATLFRQTYIRLKVPFPSVNFVRMGRFWKSVRELGAHILRSGRNIAARQYLRVVKEAKGFS